MANQRNAVESCWEGFEAFKAFKGCWKRARWQFQSPIETGCGASEVPDSSFEGQQKQLVAPWEVSWQSSETSSKLARRVLRVLRLLRGAGNVPDGSFEAPIETGCGAAEVPDSSFEAPIETGCGASEVPESSFEA